MLQKIKLSYISEKGQKTPLDKIYVFKDDKSDPYLLKPSEVT